MKLKCISGTKLLIFFLILSMLAGCSKGAPRQPTETQISGEVKSTEHNTEKVQSTLKARLADGSSSSEKEDPSSDSSIETSKELVTEKSTENTTQKTTSKPSCNLAVTDEYYKYEYAYKSGDSSGLSSTEQSFFTNLKACLDTADVYLAKVDKEKAVHDWIVLNCEYDYDNLQTNTIPESSYYAEGVFVYGKAVCDGYSKAFKLCMDILGIENIRVTGTASGVGHAWNAVKLDDNQWYMIDVTWDDPVPDEAGKVQYGYFNITDEKMMEDHSYTLGVSCTATEYSYWNYYESGRVRIDSTDDFFNKISQKIKEGAASLDVLIDYNVGCNTSALYDYDRMKNLTGMDAVAQIEFDSNDGWIVINGNYMYGTINITYAASFANSADCAAYVKQMYDSGHRTITVYVTASTSEKDAYAKAVCNAIGRGLSYRHEAYGNGMVMKFEFD